MEISTVTTLSPSEISDLITCAVANAIGKLDDRLISRREAAAILSVHPRTIKNMVKRCDLTEHRVAGQARYSKNEILNKFKK